MHNSDIKKFKWAGVHDLNSLELIMICMYTVYRFFTIRAFNTFMKIVIKERQHFPNLKYTF